MRAWHVMRTCAMSFLDVCTLRKAFPMSMGCPLGLGLKCATRVGRGVLGSKKLWMALTHRV
jgi:hypothetical protein